LEKLEETQFSLRNPDNFALLQDHVTAQMRSILVNWLLEVNAQLGFKRETYYLTVSLLDRALQQIPSILSGEFQLLGVVCLIISAKFEVI
jgi:Cyclin, N-terminal domain